MDHALNKNHLDVKTYPQHEGEQIIVVVYVDAYNYEMTIYLSHKLFTTYSCYHHCL